MKARTAVSLLLLAAASQAYCADYLDIAPSEHAAVRIEEKTVLRQQLPAALLGFNVNHHFFQQDFWRADRNQVDPKVTEALQPFAGSIYRYPGGLVANRFAWEEAVGPVANRAKQRTVQGDPGAAVLFGVNEYLNFMSAVHGRPLYVLNLVGWDEEQMEHEQPSAQMAHSNAELAKLIKQSPAAAQTPRYYQLGNELDRAKYQWNYKKYVDRATDTIKAINAVDSDARFIAFLRDFDWNYQGELASEGVSRFQDFIPAVLQGLPNVDDFSMHFYYDDPGDDRKVKLISWRLKQFQRAIEVAEHNRDRARVGVWITEHARGVNQKLGKAASRSALTSNLSAALSTTDFLIALAQIPEVKGACWHGLNAGPWQLFDATIAHRDLRPRPVYWAMRVLKTMDLPMVLGTVTQSPNLSHYAGGYDIRSVAFTDAAHQRIGLWVVNRAASSTELSVSLPSWKARKVSVKRSFIAGAEGGNAEDENVKMDIEVDPKSESAMFSDKGVLVIKLPPLSASSIVIQQN